MCASPRRRRRYLRLGTLFSSLSCLVFVCLFVFAFFVLRFLIAGLYFWLLFSSCVFVFSEFDLLLFSAFVVGVFLIVSCSYVLCFLCFYCFQLLNFVCF